MPQACSGLSSGPQAASGHGSGANGGPPVAHCRPALEMRGADCAERREVKVKNDAGTIVQLQVE